MRKVRLTLPPCPSVQCEKHKNFAPSMLSSKNGQLCRVVCQARRGRVCVCGGGGGACVCVCLSVCLSVFVCVCVCV